MCYVADGVVVTISNGGAALIWWTYIIMPVGVARSSALNCAIEENAIDADRKISICEEF